MNQTNILYKKSNQETNYLFRLFLLHFFVNTRVLCVVFTKTQLMYTIRSDIMGYVTYIVCLPRQTSQLITKYHSHKIQSNFTCDKLSVEFLGECRKKNCHKQYSTLLYTLQSGLIVGIENYVKKRFRSFQEIFKKLLRRRRRQRRLKNEFIFYLRISGYS